MTTVERHSFKVLDGIRGVAALSVVIYHFHEMLRLPAFRAGYLAVDLFFCLSGFVVSYAYQQRLSTSMTFGQFARIRLVRLWPLIALGTSLSAAVIVADQQLSGHEVVDGPWLTALALNLLVLPMLVGRDHRMFFANPPEWSLFFELAVNVAYGLVARRLTDRAIMLLMIVAFPVLALGIGRSGTANIGWDRVQFAYGLARVTYSFFAGVLIFRRFGRLSELFPFRHPALVLLVTAVPFTLPVSALLRPVFDALFILVGSPMLVCWGASAGQGAALRRTVSLLGRISYPLYALHAAFALAAAAVASRYPAQQLPVTLLAMAVLVPVSLLAADRFDIPVRRRLSRWLGLQARSA